MIKRIVTLLPQDAPLVAQLEREIYPLAMADTVEDIVDTIMSTDLSRGILSRRRIIGYLLAHDRGFSGEAYIADIGIAKRWQGQGLCSLLLASFFGETKRRGLDVTLHCRSTSYPIFSNARRTANYGYSIADDVLLADWYFGEYGVHEDAHFMRLKPA
jgi:ribosomal protein S18 acetylase RimI-like enzyme